MIRNFFFIICFMTKFNIARIFYKLNNKYPNYWLQLNIIIIHFTIELNVNYINKH